MIERLLITAGIMGVVGFAVAFGGFVQKAKVSNEAKHYAHNGVPTLLYFWSEACAPCTLVQTPALNQLEAETREVKVVRVNALEEPDLANKWCVMTVPTTILLNREGEPTYINNRAVRLPELKQQLGELGVVTS